MTWSRQAVRMFLALVTAVATVAGLAAYESGGTQSKSSTQALAAPNGKKITLSWWSMNDPGWVKGDKELIARFEKANPNITIQYQSFPYDAFISKLQASYRAGNASDMQQMFGTWVLNYARRGELAQVPASLGKHLAHDYWPATTGGYTYNGHFFGMPQEYNIENGGMLVNMQMLRQAHQKVPKTWSQLISAAKKLTIVKNGKIQRAGFDFISNNPDSPTFLFLSMILQQGASFWAKDGKHIDFSTPAAKKAWLEEAKLLTTYHIDTSEQFTGDSFEVFFRKQTAMAMRGPWAISTAHAEFPQTFHTIKWCYCVMPPTYGHTVKFAAESGWGEVVNAKDPPQVQAAAWKFISFMEEPQNIILWNKATVTVPPLKSLRYNRALLKVYPYMKIPFAILPYGRWVGPVQDRDAMWGYVRDGLIAVELHKAQPLPELKAVEKRINLMINQHIGP